MFEPRTIASSDGNHFCILLQRLQSGRALDAHSVYSLHKFAFLPTMNGQRRRRRRVEKRGKRLHDSYIACNNTLSLFCSSLAFFSLLFIRLLLLYRFGFVLPTIFSSRRLLFSARFATTFFVFIFSQLLPRFTFISKCHFRLFFPSCLLSFCRRHRSRRPPPPLSSILVSISQHENRMNMLLTSFPATVAAFHCFCCCCCWFPSLSLFRFSFSPLISRCCEQPIFSAAVCYFLFTLCFSSRPLPTFSGQ